MKYDILVLKIDNSLYFKRYNRRGNFQLNVHLKKAKIYKGIIFILLFLFGYFIIPISLPIILAWVTAVFLMPIVTFLNQQRRLTPHLSIFITFTAFLMLIITLPLFLGIKLVQQINYFIQTTPDAINQITFSWLQFQKNIQLKFEEMPQVTDEINIYVVNALNNLKIQLTSLDYIGNITNILSNIPGYFVSVLVYLIALYLFLLELPLLKQKFYSFLTPETAAKIKLMQKRFRHVIVGFFKAQILVSIPIFIVSYIGLLLIKPEVALIMALIIWIIDIIPLIGSIIVMGPWIGYQFIIGDTSFAIQLSILAVILLIIRRAVEPKIMGEQIGLSPLATLISLYLGLMLFGALGLFLGPLILIAFKSAQEAEIINWKVKL